MAFHSAHTKQALRGNVGHENGNKTTASIHFINLFPFYPKSKQAFYSGLALKNLPKKTHPIKPGLKWFFCFLIFYFLRYLKAFYINYINSNSITKHTILPCNSRKTYVYTYISYE